MKNLFNVPLVRIFGIAALVAAIGFSMAGCDWFETDPVTPVPITPTQLTATAVSSTQINLSWNGDLNATGYHIYRAANSAGPFDQTGSSFVASFSDTDLTANTTYYYRVASYSGGGVSAQSITAQATTQSGVVAPSTPAGLAATAAPGQINLSWTAVTGATGYYVYRSATESGTFTQVGDSNATTYSNTGLAPDTEYFYQVAAYNSGGTSERSSSVEATTPNMIHMIEGEYIYEDEDEDNLSWLSPQVPSRAYWFPVTNGTRYYVYLYDWDFDRDWVDAVVTGRYFGEPNANFITLESYTTWNNIPHTNASFNRVDPSYLIPMTFVATRDGFVVLTIERFNNTSTTVQGWFDLVYTIEDSASSSINLAPPAYNTATNARSAFTVSNPLAPPKPGRGVNLQKEGYIKE